MWLLKKNYLMFTKREYRPTWIVYIPLYVWYLYKVIQFGSRWWIMASNPWLKNAWLIKEDKWTALLQFDDSIKPKTLLWLSSVAHEKIIEHMKYIGIDFPCIVKADISRRSQKIRIVFSEQELKELSMLWWWDIVIQQYLQWYEEFGISYARIPWDNHWKILGIMHRSFAKVIWDWVHTLSELISKDQRYSHYVDILEQQNSTQWYDIIPQWKIIELMPFGAHSRGTVFEDRTNQSNHDIVVEIDNAAKQVQWFYVGRFDIKAKSLEHIARWEFFILELNGVWWIPAHMYDPHYSLWKWWKLLFDYRSNVAKVVKVLLKQKQLVLPGLKKMYTIVFS